jgi:hypothetical protein
VRIKITAVFFVLAACLAGAERALACSCLGPVPPCQEYGQASAVFVGTVTGVRTKKREGSGVREWTPRVFKFSVEHSYLGAAGPEIEVATGMGGGDCGYGFQRGEKYLVYAYNGAEGGRLTTGICSRTRPYGAAAEDLAFLNGLGSTPAGVQITGRVFRELRGGDDHEGTPSVTVVVTGEGRTQEVVTDAQGRFRLAGLRPGAYKLELRAPAGLMAHQSSREVKVADRGCAEVDFYLVDDGRVGGRVTDAEGQPVPKILLDLVAEEEAGEDSASLFYAEADAEGRFEFEALPPGRYLLGVRLGRGARALADNPNAEFPRVYYPGVAEASEAVPVVVGQGERVSGRDLRLPPRLTVRMIGGRALFADGRPAAGATVQCHNLTYGSDCESGAEADAQGVFALRAFEGFDYLVKAYVNLDGGRQMHAEWIERPSGSGGDEVVLRVTEPGGNCARCNARTSKRPSPRRSAAAPTPAGSR